MGGTDKGTSSKGSAGKSKGLVSEATISKLLNDFSCASLLISNRPNQRKTQRSAQEEPHPSYEEVVSSLKHLHLKKPISARRRLKEKKVFERKAKAVSADKYNLSVAANNFQKPILWPGKLNDVSKNAVTPTFLQPCRLSVTSKSAQMSSSVSFNPSFQISSSEEKTRIVDCLNKADQSFFKTPNNSNANSSKSFSDLCTETMPCSARCCEPSENPSKCCQPSANSLNGQTCCHIPHAKHQQKISALKNDKEPCNLYVFSSYRSPKIANGAMTSCANCSFLSETAGPSNISKEGKGNFSSNCSLEECAAGRNQRLKPDPSPGLAQSPISSPGALERSCSEEVRMEESNVNELASYFEDLLHIPRKMSVMAEMMYA